jgi:fumarate reductase subunit D
MSKRSIQPVFWLLFGAGGMLSALVGWMLVFITGIAIPLGILFAPDVLSYPNALAFARNALGKAFLFVVISLFIWHGAQRIYHSLHDFGIHATTASAIACYGIALMATLAAASALLRIGF